MKNIHYIGENQGIFWFTNGKESFAFKSLQAAVYHLGNLLIIEGDAISSPRFHAGHNDAMRGADYDPKTRTTDGAPRALSVAEVIEYDHGYMDGLIKKRSSDVPSPGTGVLEFGETPWDKMDRESLLREVQRMYSAVSSLHSALSLCKGPLGPNLGPYWKLYGSGGQALAKGDHIIASIEANYNCDEVYHAFFRYADDLLFTRGMGFNWQICTKCRAMIGNKDLEGKPCKDWLLPHCDGMMRPIQWSDLQPKPKSP